MADGSGHILENAFDHAKWRVSYFRSLFAAHLAIPHRWRDDSWHEKATLYQARLKVAEDELRRLQIPANVPPPARIGQAA